MHPVLITDSCLSSHRKGRSVDGQSSPGNPSTSLLRAAARSSATGCGRVAPVWMAGAAGRWIPARSLYAFTAPTVRTSRAVSCGSSAAIAARATAAWTEAAPLLRSACTMTYTPSQTDHACRFPPYQPRRVWGLQFASVVLHESYKANLAN